MLFIWLAMLVSANLDRLQPARVYRFECWRLVCVKDQVEAEAESELLLGSWMFLRGPRIEGREGKEGKTKQWATYNY